MGNSALSGYNVEEKNTASGGPGLMWKIHEGIAKDTKAHIIDKKKGVKDKDLLALCKSDASSLAKFRHPHVVQVTKALQENSEALVLVTEPIFCSLANLLRDYKNVGRISDELTSYALEPLEIKIEVQNICTALAFLHESGGVIHNGINPENIFITTSGQWKLGGFQNLCPQAQPQRPSSTLPPPLDYTAPELVLSPTNVFDHKADIFSLGCLLFRLFTEQTLINSENQEKNYKKEMKTLFPLKAADMIPPSLMPTLELMLHPNPENRPTIRNILDSAFFKDILVRTLTYLSSIVEKTDESKSQFYKSLPTAIPQFSEKILVSKILPPLILDLRSTLLIPCLLPSIFSIGKQLRNPTFLDIIFPALLKVFQVEEPFQVRLLLLRDLQFLFEYSGKENVQKCTDPLPSTLLSSPASPLLLPPSVHTSEPLTPTSLLPLDPLLHRCNPSFPLIPPHLLPTRTPSFQLIPLHLLHKCTPVDPYSLPSVSLLTFYAVILPMVFSSFQHRLEVVLAALQVTPIFIDHVSSMQLKTFVLPAIEGICTGAEIPEHVKIKALQCYSKILPKLSDEDVCEVFSTLGRCAMGPPNVRAAAVGVCDGISERLGPVFSAIQVLPFVAPFLIDPQMDQKLFPYVLGIFQKIVHRIEVERYKELGASSLPTAPGPVPSFPGSLPASTSGHHPSGHPGPGGAPESEPVMDQEILEKLNAKKTEQVPKGAVLGFDVLNFPKNGFGSSSGVAITGPKKAVDSFSNLTLPADFPEIKKEEPKSLQSNSDPWGDFGTPKKGTPNKSTPAAPNKPLDPWDAFASPKSSPATGSPVAGSGASHKPETLSPTKTPANPDPWANLGASLTSAPSTGATKTKDLLMDFSLPPSTPPQGASTSPTKPSSPSFGYPILSPSNSQPNISPSPSLSPSTQLPLFPTGAPATASSQTMLPVPTPAGLPQQPTAQRVSISSTAISGQQAATQMQPSLTEQQRQALHAQAYAHAQAQAQARAQAQAAQAHQPGQAQFAQAPLTPQPMAQGPRTPQPMTQGPLTSQPMTQGPLTPQPMSQGLLTPQSLVQAPSQAQTHAMAQAQQAQAHAQAQQQLQQKLQQQQYLFPQTLSPQPSPHVPKPVQVTNYAPVQTNPSTSGWNVSPNKGPTPQGFGEADDDDEEWNFSQPKKLHDFSDEW